MKFIFTCGGTAGHINPALALAGRLRELLPDCRILFIGAEGKMEMELVPREGFEILPIKITNLSRGRSLEDISHNLQTLKNVLLSTREARKIIREFEPDAVIGTGGYECYPVLKAASELYIPTLVHESNAVPGLTTRMLSKKVDLVMVGLEESLSAYPKARRVELTGTPVRGKFSCYTRDSAKAELGLPPDMPLVLSVWGSLGAGRMNAVMGEFISLMGPQRDFRLIHAAGGRYYGPLTDRLRAAGVDWTANGADVRDYIYDMPRVMAAADLILCRAGASTLSELTYMGKPVFLVPSPNVTNNHQEKNARVLERAGGALVLKEEELDAAGLLDTVREHLASPGKLEGMSRAMASLAVPEATDKICGMIIDLAHRAGA